ncbi:glycoside hydrolase family 75 protein [Aspergillus undulatus]|uniref:glycoside hydrolase family 75 protein n=1 Tax=Aspergillus undulatus TaxID=1810928 RepID=UPI003CCD759A
MARKTGHIFSLAFAFFLLALLGVSAARTVHPSAFSASKDIDVKALLSASERVKNAPAHATYPLSIKDFTAKSTIHSDWASFHDGAAYVFKADMDTDCDGLNYKCDGNADGQLQTTWGALSAFEVPFIVIPQAFLEANPVAIPGNNVAAVICNNKMFYAILGDSNGNFPQVMGEASWLLAHSCFPEANLSGSKGHDESDVTYILFTGPGAVLPPSALNANYITDFAKLRSMGDALTTSLSTNLGIPLLGSGSSHDKGQHDGPKNPPSSPPKEDTPSTPSPPSEEPPSSSEDDFDNGHHDGPDTDTDNADNQDGTPTPSVRPGPPPSSAGSAPPESDETDDFDSGARLQIRGTVPELMALFLVVLVLAVT